MSTAAPTTGVELAEALGENGPVLNDAAKAAIQGYVSHAVESGVETKLQEQTQALFADWARSQEAADGARPQLAAAPRVSDDKRPANYNPHAAGAVLDKVFDGIGDVLQVLNGERLGNPKALQRAAQIRNDFSSTVPADGGFLVPEDTRAQLLSLALSDAIVRPRATTIAMGAPRINFPMVDFTSGASHVFGGITGAWSEEGGTIATSTPAFGKVTLDAQKLVLGAKVPNELLQDSAFSVTQFINQAYPQALRWFEDIAFIRGSGVGEPLGFLTAANTAQVTVAKESGQAADTIVWENIVQMYSRMLPNSLSNAVWVAHPNTFPELATMALSVGTGGSAVWLNNGVSGPPATILGRPLYLCEKMETLGDAGDIAFVDFSYYLIGDRQQMSAMTSEHVYFTTDQVAYRLIERVDGRPWLRDPYTPNKGSTTLSPFVKLAARA